MSKVVLTGFLLALLHVSFTPAAAQDRETVTQGTEWFSAASNTVLGKRVSLLAEANFRFVQDFEPMQIQVRIGPEVKLSKSWSIIPLGYVYTWNPLYGKQPNVFSNNEHRLFEQVGFKHSAGNLKLSHRFRLEQRYTQVHSIENNEVVNHGYDMHTNRLRYKLVGEFHLGQAVEGKPWVTGVVSEEIFLSFGEAVTYHEPDQNRLFAGVAYHFTKDFSIQGGPFYQIQIKSGGTKQENNVGVQFSLMRNFDLSKD